MTTAETTNSHLDEIDARAKSAARRAETATQGTPAQIRAQQEADELYAHYYEWRDAMFEIEDLDEKLSKKEHELEQARIVHAAPNTTVLDAATSAAGVTAAVALLFAMITGSVWVSLLTAVAAVGAIAAWVRSSKIKQSSNHESPEAVQLTREVNDLKRKRKNALPDPPSL